ncbi:MAG: di-trans,poly-cis-decaprenylcistransferase [Alistipes sp.]|nr:di-trans,poly-cis-decaprenylcistransferase [Alistipes sp.]
MSEKRTVPRHVAIIMDGNGRWAKQRGKERYEGHIEGVTSVREAVKSAVRNGVEYLTLYAFSTENWGRPAEEVEALMSLFCRSVINEAPELIAQGVRVKVIGHRSRFSRQVREHLEEIERSTAQGERLTLILAIDYSSRDEMTDAVRRIAREVAEGRLTPEEISVQTVGGSLYTAGIPDPDLIVRTGGESRLSNFLLWQASYAELYFPTLLWPDFREADFEEALRAYASRERRFGLVSDGVK